MQKRRVSIQKEKGIVIEADGYNSEAELYQYRSRRVSIQKQKGIIAQAKVYQYKNTRVSIQKQNITIQKRRELTQKQKGINQYNRSRRVSLEEQMCMNTEAEDINTQVEGNQHRIRRKSTQKQKGIITEPEGHQYRSRRVAIQKFRNPFSETHYILLVSLLNFR